MLLSSRGHIVEKQRDDIVWIALTVDGGEHDSITWPDFIQMERLRERSIVLEMAGVEVMIVTLSGI
jgi:hypothetical protein